MAKFRKKPVVIEAVQWDGDNISEMTAHMNGRGIFRLSGLEIRTLEGTMRAEVGDWIIRGVQGEFYPCKPDIFEATYDPVPAPEGGANG